MKLLIYFFPGFFFFKDDDSLLANESKKPKSGPSGTPPNVPPINLIEELNVAQYLVLKKEKEEGPDVKGGYLDALIVHASRVQKVTENGKLMLCELDLYLAFCWAIIVGFFVRFFFAHYQMKLKKMVIFIYILH